MCGCITEDHINVCPTCGNTAFSPIMYQQQTYNNQPNYNNQPTPSITAPQPAKPKKRSKLFIILPIFLAVMVIVIAVELITLSKYRKAQTARYQITPQMATKTSLPLSLMARTITQTMPAQ